MPVKCEYPASRGFDVAIIDPGTHRTYDENVWKAEGLKSDAFWNQPVLAGVELKYCQLGDRRELRSAGCNSDIDKLRRYLEERGKHSFLGLSLLFIQSASLDPAIFFDGTELHENPNTGLRGTLFHGAVGRDSPFNIVPAVPTLALLTSAAERVVKIELNSLSTKFR